MRSRKNQSRQKQVGQSQRLAEPPVGDRRMRLQRAGHPPQLDLALQMIAEEGLIGFAFTAALSYVAPAGGTKPLYGTNPMAYAVPAGTKYPIVFDIATAASGAAIRQAAPGAGSGRPCVPR